MTIKSYSKSLTELVSNDLNLYFDQHRIGGLEVWFWSEYSIALID